jgi:hypothetical protein
MAITSPGYDASKHFNLFEQHDARQANIHNTSTNTHRATRNDIRTAENNFNPQTAFDNSLIETSTNVFVFANGGIVGMIQSFSVSETRNINKLQAIGYEGVVQAVPDNTKGGTLSVSRISLYENQIWNALGLTTSGRAYTEVGAKVYDATSEGPVGGNDWNKSTTANSLSDKSYKTNTNYLFATLKQQRVPLEIQVKTKAHGANETYFVETYIDCWLNSFKRTYSVASITVAEDVSISYADVY